jgi:hypothetical protein
MAGQPSGFEGLEIDYWNTLHWILLLSAPRPAMLRSSASNAQSRNRRCAVGAIVFGFFDEAFKLIDNVKFNTRLAELYKYLGQERLENAGL